MTAISAEQFKPKPGTMSALLFDNPHIGLAPTLFYDISIPLEPFDSGDESEPQPIETSFCLYFIRLPVSDWRKLDGCSFEVEQDDADCSIYLNDAYNPVDIQRIAFTRVGDFRFKIECVLFCDFEYEMVGESITVPLVAEVEFKGLEIKYTSSPASADAARAAIAAFVPADAYEAEPQISQYRIFFAPCSG
jgi:hypothetical protein